MMPYSQGCRQQSRLPWYNWSLGCTRPSWMYGQQYCTNSFNSPVTRHTWLENGEMSRLSRITSWIGELIWAPSIFGNAKYRNLQNKTPYTSPYIKVYQLRRVIWGLSRCRKAYLSVFLWEIHLLGGEFHQVSRVTIISGESANSPFVSRVTRGGELNELVQ
jgi:hypothetical protein